MIKNIFNKAEILDLLSNLEIFESNGVIVTKYNGRVIKTKDISTRYESFDFSGYVNKVIDSILQHFEIKKYELTIKGGIQQLILKSEERELDGEIFELIFVILNSSDKTRALNVSLGLTSDKYTFITEAGTIYKKHYTGINDYVDEKLNIDTEVFKQQLELIKSLKGEEISLKDIKTVITTSTLKDKYLSSQETIYSNFLYSYYHSLNQEDDNRKRLYKIIYSSKDKENLEDLYLDSYKTFIIYLRIFKHKDSFVIKNESERILRLSKYFKRRNIMSILNS